MTYLIRSMNENQHDFYYSEHDVNKPHRSTISQLSYTLSREYRVAISLYSRLLFISEDRFCAELRVQQDSANMTSQCLYPTFV